MSETTDRKQPVTIQTCALCGQSYPQRGPVHGMPVCPVCRETQREREEDQRQ